MNLKTLSAALVKKEVPVNLHDGLLNYILFGVAPGGFLSAVLINNLFAAYDRSDNAAQIEKVVRFLQNDAPNACYGSPIIFQRWKEHNGIEGLKV